MDRSCPVGCFFLQAVEEGVKVWPLLLAVALTLAFYFYEKKKVEPFINVNFLRKNLNISFIYVQYVLATVVFFAMLLAMPAYFQMVLHLDSKTAGIMMLSLSVFAMMMTPIATRWTERHGFRIPLLFGSIVGIIGVGLLLTAHQSSPLYWLFMILAILGISNGALSISSQNLLYSFVTKEQSGIASGLLMTSRFIGNILASSLYGVVYATGISDANKNSMTIVLLIVSFVMIPGVFFVTKRKASEGEI